MYFKIFAGDEITLSLIIMLYDYVMIDTDDDVLLNEYVPHFLTWEILGKHTYSTL